MRNTIPTPHARRDAEGPTLYPVVQELVGSLQRRHADTGVPLPQLTVDVSPGHVLPGDAEIVKSLLEQWLAEAVRAAAGNAAMARSAEVVITSVQYADRLEVEIADTGPAVTCSEGVPVRQSQGDYEQQPSRHFLIVCRLQCGLMTARRVVSP